MDKEELYAAIDDDDSLSDEEKREAYFSEIDNEDAEEGWQNGQ